MFCNPYPLTWDRVLIALFAVAEGWLLLDNIYTPSVFCYDKHKKDFDIQFSMKRHETV